MLEETKKLIERQVKDGFYFDLIDYKSICQPVYLWTNENVRVIKIYLKVRKMY